MTAIYAELLDLLRAVANPGPHDDGRDAVWPLSERFLDLFLYLRSQPGGAPAEDLRNFLAQSAPLMQRAAFSLDLLLIGDLENLLRSAWFADEWQRVCRTRSALAAIMELYRGSSAEQELADLSLDEVDELIRHRGHDEGYVAPEQVPNGTPADHWWWWYPNSPPSETP